MAKASFFLAVGLLLVSVWHKHLAQDTSDSRTLIHARWNFEGLLKPTSGPYTQAHPRVGRFSSRWITSEWSVIRPEGRSKVLRLRDRIGCSVGSSSEPGVRGIHVRLPRAPMRPEQTSLVAAWWEPMLLHNMSRYPLSPMVS